MRPKRLQKWFILFLAAVFLVSLAVPGWAAGQGKSNNKGKANVTGSVQEQEKESQQLKEERANDGQASGEIKKEREENKDLEREQEQDREQEREQEQDREQMQVKEQERERVGEAVYNADGLRLRLEVELEKETRAGLKEDELPEKSDRAGLQKLAEELAAKLAAQPGDLPLMHRLAVYYRNLRDYDKAVSLCQEILAADPANQPALVLMALSYREKGDYAAAIAQLQQLLAENETVGHSVYAYLGILHEAAGNLAQAVESVEKAVYAAGTGQKEYRYRLGELYARANVPGLKIFVHGRKVTPDVPPLIENGRTMAPVRAIAEALGLKVAYENGTVLITNPADGKTITLFAGRPEALAGNQKITLEAAAEIKGDRLFVPLRFVGETLGASVEYIGEGRIVTVD